METKAYVWVTAQFETVHRDPQAPAHTGYQRSHHRHIMRVRLEKQVAPDEPATDRIVLKHQLEGTIVKCLQIPGENPAEGAAHQLWSCQDWAQKLIEVMDADRVEVSEDGELGSVIVRQGRVLLAQAEALPGAKAFKSPKKGVA